MSHWDDVYARKAPAEVSWFEASPALSLDLVTRAGLRLDGPIVDVGAGASTLVDALLARGHLDVTLLDVAESAFAASRARLAAHASRVHYVVSDVTHWTPSRTYALWHDRAAFHFLVSEADRAAYKRALAAALGPGGKAIVATFALDGPERCSGLPVQRYSAMTLAKELGDVLRLTDARAHLHRTPSGASQSFLYALFERI
ncbi:MAG: class I SAM-dependent methyltransferase [Labilithrix sp.]|nr:class I SAM-dependent methyltransferase [Labilithrix sp.]